MSCHPFAQDFGDVVGARQQRKHTGEAPFAHCAMVHNGGFMFYDERAGSTVLSAVHAGPSAVHAGPSAVHAGPSAVHAGPSAVHAGPSAVTRGGRVALSVKIVFDRCAALLALVALLPLWIVVALAIRCTSRGSVLFRQTRVGRNGRSFTMLKFRSMYDGAERNLVDLAARNDSLGGVLFKMREDPRVTPVGRVLRRLSLDELPQLLNVLTGSMSLVGPRPPLPSEVARYGADARRRLLVRPGLTGLWQVSGRSDLSWEDSLQLDLQYVETWSLALDTAVLLKTVPAVLRAEGAY